MLSMKRSKLMYAKTNETAYVVDETSYNAPTEETAFIQEQVSFKIFLTNNSGDHYEST